MAEPPPPYSQPDRKLFVFKGSLWPDILVSCLKLKFKNTFFLLNFISIIYIMGLFDFGTFHGHISSHSFIFIPKRCVNIFDNEIRYLETQLLNEESCIGP